MMTVDFDKLRIILTPHALRGGALFETLLRTLYRPLKTLYAEFRRYVEKEESDRQYGSTVKQLRQAVADHLGIEVEEVVFGTVADRDTVDLRRATDGNAVALKRGSATALWTDDMVWWNREFTVTLPAIYQSSETEVKALLDRWKMACSRYTIKYA